MPDLQLEVQEAQAVPYAATPLLALKLRIRNTPAAEEIASILLQCQVQIEAQRCPYSEPEQARLLDLFGEPERWGQTLRTMLWTHSSVNVPRFSSEVSVDLLLPCTFDFNVAATKYFHALEQGTVPLCLLFSGTVFYVDPERGVQVSRVPWNKEARYKLPVEVWKTVVDLYYPNTSWLSLRRDVFDRLYQYKIREGIASWEQALETLLASAQDGVLT